ncbi:MAG TPA: hypothetical protein VF098_07555 [Sphingomicrobium sp.]|jgi:hypothetical protein
MRAALTLLPAAFVLSCTGAKPSPTINRVTMRISGWSATDISVNSRGEARYHRSLPRPNGTNGSFSISPAEFANLVQRLEPFRKNSIPVTADSMREFALGETCPPGKLTVIDVGAVWVRWQGPGYDQHYLADLGCDVKRNAERNHALLEIVESLPAPQPKA